MLRAALPIALLASAATPAAAQYREDGLHGGEPGITGDQWAERPWRHRDSKIRKAYQPRRD